MMQGGGDEEMQRAYMQGQQLQQELQAIQEQQEQLKGIIQDLDTGRGTVEALQKVDEGEEVLLPVGAGLFVRASLADPDSVVVNVGSDVHVESPLEEALEHLDERSQNLEDVKETLQEESQKLQEELQELSGRLQGLQGGGQPRRQPGGQG